MRRAFVLGVATMTCLAAWVVASLPHSGLGQRPGVRGIRGARGELGSRISGERSTRTVEVMRLEQSIGELQTRVQRLERQMVAGPRLPAFTIDESEAELAYAEAQLAASQRDVEAGDASEVDVAANRVKVVRARSQLLIAKAAYADRLLELESELALARRELSQASKDQQQLERLAAKGYTSSDSLDLKQIDVEIAKNAVLRLQSRLELFRNLNTESESESDSESQSESDSAEEVPKTPSPPASGETSPVSGSQP